MSFFHNNALAGASGQTTGGDSDAYQIEKSLRFNSADSAYLSRTPGSAGNQRTWTWSGWVKFGEVIDNKQQHIWDAWVDSSNYVLFDCDDMLRLKATVGGSTKVELQCNRELRDPSAWYHLQVVVDTTNTTQEDRVRIYVNGHRETSFSTATYPAQDQKLELNKASLETTIGKRLTSYFDGYMTDVHFIDGLASVSYTHLTLPTKA